MEYTRQHNYDIHGNYYTTPLEMAVGNVYVFAEEYCPSNTQIYIANHPDAVGNLVFLWFFKMENGIPIYMGASDDYTISTGDLGSWVNLNSWIDAAYQPGDTAVILYGTYGATFPVPYSQTSVNSSVIVADGIGNWSVAENGPAFMINLEPYSADDCWHCYIDLPENSDISVAIFPNPANDKIYLKNLSVPIQKIIIYTLDGRVVYKQKEYGINEIDISFLQNGTYLIFIETEEGTTYTEKIVKM